MKRNDWILAGAIVAAACIFFMIQAMTPKDASGYAVVQVDGRVVARYELGTDQEISIQDGTNILVIHDGKAKMKEASCPDQVCVHQKAISKQAESIICLPNRVVVTIEGAQASQTDAIT